MSKSTHRWRLIIGLICVALVAAACFQSVGDVPQGNAISERVSEVPSNTPTETEIPTDAPTPEDSVAQAVDQVIADDATATLEGTAVAQSGEGEGGNQPDPFQLTATELIRTATEGVAIQQTQTAQALGIGATETPTATATIDPFAFATATLFGQPTQPFLTGADCLHEVRAGETLFRMSMYYGLPVNTIAAANAIVNPNVIIVGQKLVISGCGTTGALPPPTSVPTATLVPIGFGTGGFELTPGATTLTQPSLGVCGGQYIVQQYDTLFQISLRCGVPVQSIANANGILDINRINMGTTLTIPAQ